MAKSAQDIVYDTLEAVTGQRPVKGTHQFTKWPQMFDNNYAANYFNIYIGSRVIAQDMFTRFEKEGIESKEAFRDLRAFLEEGAREKPGVLIERFLGRSVQRDPFFRWLGIGDNAVAKEGAGDKAAFTKGGIDFNAEALKMNEQGTKFEFQFDDKALQNIDPATIKGIQPVIINVTPVTNFFQLLGMTGEQDNNKGPSVPETVAFKEEKTI